VQKFQYSDPWHLLFRRSDVFRCSLQNASSTTVRNDRFCLKNGAIRQSVCRQCAAINLRPIHPRPAQCWPHPVRDKAPADLVTLCSWLKIWFTPLLPSQVLLRTACSLSLQYFCISRNRNEAVQVIITKPVSASSPVRYLRGPTGTMSPKPMVV